MVNILLFARPATIKAWFQTNPDVALAMAAANLLNAGLNASCSAESATERVSSPILFKATLA